MAYIQYPGAKCGQLDVTKISIDDYLASGGGVGVAAQGNIWVRASVDEKVYADGYDRGKVVFKFNDPCVVTLCPNDFTGGQNVGAASDTILGLTEGNIPSDSTASYLSNDGSQNFQLDVSDVTEHTKRRVDAPLINQYSMFPAAIMPCAVAVPLRSNIRPYGPYATGNFHNSCGGINVNVDKDIAPWVFGSVDLMNTAAMIRLSTNEPDPLVIGTTGSVTVPCLPQIGLGSSMLLEGPVLNGLSVNFGNGGVSTTYSYQTFTPKFGSFSQATLDRLKLISKNRREQLKLLRNDQVLTNRIARQVSKVDYSSHFISDAKHGMFKEASLHRVFIGEMQDWWKDINCPSGQGQPCSCSSIPMYGPYPNLKKLTSNRVKDSQNFGDGEDAEVRYNAQRTVVGSETLSKQMLELRWDYANKAFMSMDGLLGPISVSGDGNLPQYAKYKPKCHRQAPLSPQPPFGKCSPVFKNECDDGFSNYGGAVESKYYNQKIEQKFENPVQNPTSCHHHLGTVNGHIIDILGRKQSVGDHMSMNLSPGQDYANDYRFLGLRGPLVLHSWGYDTWGKPIPNEADSESETMAGEFKEENLKDRFLCEWLSKPATWPVGPIDLRFDRDRGVWVAPPQDYKVIVVELIQDLKPLETALAQLINTDNEAGKDYGPKLWDFEGGEISATSDAGSDYVVTVEDRIKASYKCGTRLYAHYDTYSCKYIVFGQVPPTETTDIIRFKLFDDKCSPEGSGTCDWKEYAGYRDKFLNNHTFGIRINCDGKPIDMNKKELGKDDLDALIDSGGKFTDNEKKKEIVVNLYDTAGQHGPAYGLYTTFAEWKEKAHTGFAARIYGVNQPDIRPSGEGTSDHVCADCIPESGSSVSGCEEICITVIENENPDEESQEIESCACIMGSTECGCPDNNLLNYDILFLEGYARFIHATLLEDLYPEDESGALTEFKTTCLCGNSAANIDGELFYGNSPNGRKPTFYTSAGQTEFRVFDPFEEKNSPFTHLRAGDKVIALFNEKEKKYYILQSSKPNDFHIIRFSLIEDKFNTDQICTKATRVDRFNRPITEYGSLIESDAELNNNHIIVMDPIAEKAAKNPNSENNSIWGPALGSNKLNDHLNGETIYSYNRGAYSGTNIRPFTGFARSRNGSTVTRCTDSEIENPDTCSGVEVDVPTYDIIMLENFAQMIEFETAEDILEPHQNYAANFYHYYNGTAPIGRKHELAEYHHDRLVNTNIYDVTVQKQSKVVGEIIGSQGAGCKGIAKLDLERSTSDKLIYNIVDSQTQALFGKFRVLNCTGAGELNALCETYNDVECDPKNVRIYWFGGGFEWPEDDPLTCARRGNIKIINKHEWCGKWYHEPSTANGSVICTDLDEYYIYDAYPIANVKFGTYDGCGVPSGCDACDYLDGLHPTCCHPTVENCIGPFLTYSGAQYVAYWNEDSAQYNIINAEEAPILIEGKLANPIDCCGTGKADVVVYAASNNEDGLDKEPIKTLVKNCANPRGWCGHAGDEIVIHRRQVGNCYEYKVLHLGKPCIESSDTESGSCLSTLNYEIAGCDYRYFNERIECIPGYKGGEPQNLMHGKGFGLMWLKPKNYYNKTIYGCWDGVSLEVQSFSGFDGLDENGLSVVGQSVDAYSPGSCCINAECGGGLVFAPPSSGTAWASATYINDGEQCYWMITNAECCNSCDFPGCDECTNC